MTWNIQLPWIDGHSRPVPILYEVEDLKIGLSNGATVVYARKRIESKLSVIQANNKIYPYGHPQHEATAAIAMVYTRTDNTYPNSGFIAIQMAMWSIKLDEVRGLHVMRSCVNLDGITVNGIAPPAQAISAITNSDYNDALIMIELRREIQDIRLEFV